MNETSTVTSSEPVAPVEAPEVLPESKRVKVEQDPAIKLEIENVNEMTNSYVRTRHKNVRCFPRCSPVHKNKSFCGHSVYVEVKGKTFVKEDVIVIGEFRSTRTRPSFGIGQDVCTTDFPEAFTEGVLLKQEGDHMSFAINPVRKWKFEGKLRPMDHYVFTVFLLVEGKVVAITNTPSFSITPIWKTEGGKDGDEEDDVHNSARSGTDAGTMGTLSSLTVPISSTASIGNPAVPDLSSIGSNQSMSPFPMMPRMLHVPMYPSKQGIEIPQAQGNQTFLAQLRPVQAAQNGNRIPHVNVPQQFGSWSSSTQKLMEVHSMRQSMPYESLSQPPMPRFADPYLQMQFMQQHFGGPA